MDSSSSSTATSSTDFDVLIVGAGISGINAAHHIQRRLPGLTYAVLERRADVGGTWDLFRYPGIRSDSDLFTFGYGWHPWTEKRAIAEGSAIQAYLRDTARQEGIDRHIRFGRRVRAAAWTTAGQRWHLEVEGGHGGGGDDPGGPDDSGGGDIETYTARFLVLGTGYYDYDAPLDAEVPGLRADFRGRVVHPQFWPADLDCAGLRFAVVGSGATAVTLVPSLARAGAAHVTMVQRSPSYVLAMDNAAGTSWLHRWLLPRRWSFALSRLRFALRTAAVWYLCRLCPRAARAWLLRHMARQLPPAVPLQPHFAPRYAPWDQRLCLAPDGDFFASLRAGTAAVATGRIAAATADALVLDSGQRVEADVVVTATGLRLAMGGHIALSVDGVPADLAGRFTWHNTLVQDLPNLAVVLGYTNASWTLGAETACRLICRLLARMQARGDASVVPRLSPAAAARLEPRPLWDLTSTYVQQTARNLPRCGNKGPWRARTNYFLDLWRAQHGSLTDGLEYAKADGKTKAAT